MVLMLIGGDISKLFDKQIAQRAPRSFVCQSIIADTRKAEFVCIRFGKSVACIAVRVQLPVGTTISHLFHKADYLKHVIIRWRIKLEIAQFIQLGMVFIVSVSFLPDPLVYADRRSRATLGHLHELPALLLDRWHPWYLLMSHADSPLVAHRHWRVPNPTRTYHRNNSR